MQMDAKTPRSKLVGQVGARSAREDRDDRSVVAAKCDRQTGTPDHG